MAGIPERLNSRREREEAGPEAMAGPAMALAVGGPWLLNNGSSLDPNNRKLIGKRRFRRTRSPGTASTEKTNRYYIEKTRHPGAGDEREKRLSEKGSVEARKIVEALIKEWNRPWNATTRITEEEDGTSDDLELRGSGNGGRIP